jgi:hypothetical protein
MKKKLNTSHVTNELKGASLFFSGAVPAAPAPSTREPAGDEQLIRPEPRPKSLPAIALTKPAPGTSQPSGEEKKPEQSVRPIVRPDGRTPVRRVLKRHPFEF